MAFLQLFKPHKRFHLFTTQNNLFTTKTLGCPTLESPLTSLQCGSLLQTYTNTKSLTQGKQLHACIITCGLLLENTYLNTKLTAFYAVCGCLNYARVIFDEITLRNSFSWNCMIRGYACNGYPLDSIVLYREMLGFGQKADNFTYPFVLKACGDLLLLEIGKKVHCEIVVMGLEFDVYVQNSLMSMYSKSGDMGSARRLFDRMQRRDLTSWNTIISGYVKNHDPLEALYIFDLMGREGVKGDSTTLLSVLPACADLASLRCGKEIHGLIFRTKVGLDELSVMNSLIDMYSYCNFIVGARHLFEKVNRKDTVTWNSIIAGYSHTGDAFESLRLFCRMVADGADIDQVTLITVLVACDQITALHFGMSLHAFLIRKGFTMYTMVGTSLIDMYAKCGSLACSRRAFDDMIRRNLFSWSAMIGAYGLHGRGYEAVCIFNEMRASGIRPDEVTFTSVLSACSHAGLVEEGCKIFEGMFKEYGIVPTVKHYSCMVDLLGRVGHLDEAYELIKAMKIKPSIDIWASLLSSCRANRNVKLAEVAARNAFNLNPRRVGPYVMLSNIYAAANKWEDVERVRSMGRQIGLEKQPGCSFVELDSGSLIPCER